MNTVEIKVTPKDHILATMQSWLVETLGDAADMMLPELAQIFLEDSPPLLDGMYDAIGSQDPIVLKETSHSLKGSCSSMGLIALAEHCQFVESCSKSGDFSTAAARMPALEAEFDQVVGLFNDLV